MYPGVVAVGQPGGASNGADHRATPSSETESETHEQEQEQEEEEQQQPDALPAHIDPGLVTIIADNRPVTTPPSTSFFVNSRTLMGSRGFHYGIRGTPSVSSRVGSKLPLLWNVC